MKLKLKSSARKARVMRGHPWVFAGELETVPGPEWKGKALPLEDFKGRFLGMGIVNPDSAIVWRRYQRDSVAWDRKYWKAALERAVGAREPEPFRRLVWSEADGLPGVIVDQFNDVLVLQTVTAAADAISDELAAILKEQLEVREVLIRNDAPSRKLEGLENRVYTMSGQELKPFWASIFELEYHLDLTSSQKTGFYLDQRHEHLKVASLAEGWRVLDAFCNQGAFALNCASAGAREVLGIDISADAIELARQNAARNELEVKFECANMFDWFSANRDEKFDLIILDPPSFARNRNAVEGALRGYKELNLRALRALNPGGILATYSCSQHVDRGLFNQVLEDAARDAGRDVQLLYETGQPIDHPVRLNFPESAYLKGAILRMEG